MLKYEMLPEHCRDGMKFYIEEGVPVEDFLTAVLENNLVESFGRADNINIHRIYDYCNFLYNEAPTGSWGSKAKVEAWIDHKGLSGLKRGAPREE